MHSPLTQPHLREFLDGLLAHQAPAGPNTPDPISAPHRYDGPRDREWAGLLASAFAFGRVGLFLPKVHALLDVMDERGGPHAALAAGAVEGHPVLHQAAYRWIRTGDLHRLLRTCRKVIERHHSLSRLFQGSADPILALQLAVDELRHIAAEDGPLTRGLAYCLSSPRSGSACKRWMMMLRWFVRPADDGVDFGIWDFFSPADLVIPVDTHVTRISHAIGLTNRPHADWRNAQAITSALRQFSPEDPVRYDYSLAHLGISQGCRTVRGRPECEGCPVRDLCTFPVEG